MFKLIVAIYTIHPVRAVWPKPVKVEINEREMDDTRKMDRSLTRKPCLICRLASPETLITDATGKAVKIFEDYRAAFNGKVEDPMPGRVRIGRISA